MGCSESQPAATVVVADSYVARWIADPLARALRTSRTMGVRVPAPVEAYIADIIRLAQTGHGSAGGSAVGRSETADGDLRQQPALTTEEVASALGISTRAVTKAAQSGRLSGRRAGRAWKFDPSALEEYRSGKPVRS